MDKAKKRSRGSGSGPFAHGAPAFIFRISGFECKKLVRKLQGVAARVSKLYENEILIDLKMTSGGTAKTAKPTDTIRTAATSQRDTMYQWDTTYRGQQGNKADVVQTDVPSPPSGWQGDTEQE